MEIVRTVGCQRCFWIIQRTKNTNIRLCIKKRRRASCEVRRGDYSDEIEEQELIELNENHHGETYYGFLMWTGSPGKVQGFCEWWWNYRWVDEEECRREEQRRQEQ